jgi:hypothetical protein
MPVLRPYAGLYQPHWQDSDWLMLQDKYVEDLISRLGLVKSADTIVGDAKTRGISGAQLACWMVT